MHAAAEKQESDSPHTPLPPLNAFCFSSRYGMDLIETQLNQLPKRKKAGEQRSRAVDRSAIQHPTVDIDQAADSRSRSLGSVRSPPVILLLAGVYHISRQSRDPSAQSQSFLGAYSLYDICITMIICTSIFFFAEHVCRTGRVCLPEEHICTCIYKHECTIYVSLRAARHHVTCGPWLLLS